MPARETTEPPFQAGDPVVSWSAYGSKGDLGVGASTALRVGDEVRIYHSFYDERLDIPRQDGVIGTGFATVKAEAPCSRTFESTDSPCSGCTS